MTAIGGALFGCLLLVVGIAKVFGRFLFQDPCEGDGNYNPPMDLFYEVYEEDDTDDRRN